MSDVYFDNLDMLHLLWLLPLLLVICMYRFYMKDKAAIGKGATWKVRGKPWWWDEELADYNQRISRAA